MTTFLYRKIGQRLLDELREKVIGQSESVVLIAPRYGGKRYLMNRLYEMLQAEGLFHVLRLAATQHTDITNSREFRDWLAGEALKADGRLNEEALSSEDMFAPLDGLIARSSKPVVLLVSNVDSISQPLARDLLLKIRALVEERKLIVALSGEDIFQKLVHGPASMFNCAYQYFLHGFDRELFIEETQAYRKALGLRFDDDEELTGRLYELAGGQLSVMKILLRIIFEARFERGQSLDSPITVSGIPVSIGADLLRQPPRVINNSPECWEDLKQLLLDEVSQISSNSTEPGPLELAGVAVREGWNIRISSPLLKKFLKDYYTNKRFGDLYVRKKDFDTAFVYYEQLAEDERVRPSNSDDRREIAFTIKALAAELYFAATKSPEDVIRLFFKTCRYVLGFREAGRLQLNETWSPLAFPGYNLSEQTAREISGLLPAVEPKAGPFPIKGSLRFSALAAISPTERPHQFLAVVVCDQTTSNAISPERRKLANEFLEHFVGAYEQATQIVAARDHLETRDKHIKIVNSIFDGLGSRAHNVEHVIKMAAESLRSLGYRRVSFCLVDPERKKIKGVLDDSDDSSVVNVAAMTDWPLSDPKADIQPYVIKTKEPKIVPDAAREPLVNPKVREKARLKAFAVVPLLTQDGEAIGTMHVERKDRFAPNQQEVDDLVHFGRQLAIAIGQSERVNLQQATLDKLHSVTLIVDSTRKLRYANQIAEDTLKVKSGWRDQATAELFTKENIGEEALTMVLDSLSGQRLERRIRLPKDDSDTRYWEAFSEVIRDENHKQILGAFIQIRDVKYPRSMFKAFNLIAEAKDKASVLGRLFVAAERYLEFKWGRLYLVEPNDPDCLVSHDFFGKLPIDLQQNFRFGGIRMPRRQRPGKESWACFDYGAPQVFYFAPHRKDGEIYTTQRGQEAHVLTNPRLQAELQKLPGDFWVDLPLQRQDGQPIGKITFEWDENRWPREFDLLEVLSEMVSRRLEAFQEREREEARLQAVRTQTAQKIMAEMAHNIGSQLSPLPLILERYRQREREHPELADLNRRFALINEETGRIINRAKERLVGVSPKPSRLNLKKCLDEILQSYLDDKCFWRIDCPYENFEIEADGYLLKLALYELIQNSKDMASNSGKLAIIIGLEFDPHPESRVAKITYRDNGPGVPEKFKERIFEDFFTHHPGGAPGAGLGMGFVRRVAQAHGGEMTECGIPGRGVEFVITLPIKQATERMENTLQKQLLLLPEWQGAQSINSDNPQTAGSSDRPSESLR
ncbi:MAG: Adaptive-response sensory-kinase SasA [Gammaproteobacteria bacterium]|nr:Adaptive-response sensory-kinase SasA [Gammaproteobacteria bacterium]